MTRLNIEDPYGDGIGWKCPNPKCTYGAHDMVSPPNFCPECGTMLSDVWRLTIRGIPQEDEPIEDPDVERLAEVAHQTFHVGRWKFPWANETDEIKEGWGNVVRAILNMRNISPDESFLCEKCQNRMVYSNSKGWYCPNCGWIPPSNKRHQNLSREEENR